jgi:glyoxylase-like metal-dependent hydrolase (beta-lactamase superfamily II)
VTKDPEREAAFAQAIAPQPPGTGELAPGVVTELSPLVRRVIAPNPSMMTGPGTGTYLVGTEDLAVIDPGPDDAAHLDRLAEVAGGRVRWILYTHTHLDHSPGVPGLSERTGAPSASYRPRPDTEDPTPDVVTEEGWTLSLPGVTLRALHTPGHASNHVCWLLEEEGMLFSGDHIMNGSTVVIGPPDGDMTAYLEQLVRLRSVNPRSIAPGHGKLITDPLAKIDEYVTHRLEREGQVMAALGVDTPTTIDTLVKSIYVGVPDALHPVAQFSVWAHLRRLRATGQAACDDPEDLKAEWVGRT